MKVVVYGAGSSLAVAVMFGACQQKQCPPRVTTAPPNSGVSLVGGQGEPAPDPADPAQYPKTVSHAIVSHLPELEECNTKGRTESPQLAGFVHVAGTISPAGGVTGARVIKSTLRANVGNGPKIVEAWTGSTIASSSSEHRPQSLT